MNTEVNAEIKENKKLLKGKAAVLLNANENYKVEEVEIDELREDEVLVKIVASGICHSDEVVRNGDSPNPMPVILGHEGSGIVEKVGSHVKNIKPGDHVVLSFGYCGTCPSCLTGVAASCDEWLHLNLADQRDDGVPYYRRLDGTPIAHWNQSTFAEYTIVKPSHVTKVDPTVDLRLVGPLGCGFLTGSGTIFNGLKPEPGSTIAVYGTGAVGLATMMAAKIAGCSKIIGIDIHDHRLETAMELGATHTINSKTEDLKQKISEFTYGRGTNYAVDTTGVPMVIRSALESLAVGGTIAPIAATRTMEINTMFDLSFYNKTMKGILMGQAIPQLTIPQLIEFYKEGRFMFDKLVKFYQFEDINQANEDSKSGKTIKPILIIDKTYKPE